MALRPVHVEITHPDQVTPARGKVVFSTSYALRDSTGKVMHGPTNTVARLSAGEALVNIPPNDDPAYSPSDGTTTVVVDTDVWRKTFDVVIPAGVGTIEFADLVEVETGEPVNTYALASQLLAYLPKSGGTMTGALTLSGSPSADLHAASKRYVDETAAVGGVADATTTSKGVVQLAGDLGGTATAPTVPGLANRQPLDADLTAIAALTPTDGDLLQRTAGAWANRTPAQAKATLGLDQVDNTSDAAKPVSTATSTALAGKATKPIIRRAYITSGNVNPFPDTAGAWVALPGFELSIPAAVGDDVELTITAMRTNTESAFLDAAVIVGSTIVRYLGTGGASPGIEGDPGWYPGAPGTHYPAQNGPRGFTVTAPDLDGSNVRFVIACRGAGAGQLYASTSFPFYWRALNRGVVG